MAAIYEKTPNPSGALWSTIQDTNAKSAFLYSTHCGAVMKQNGAGRIINFSDWLPVTGRPHYKDYVPYYVSKASVAALTEALASAARAGDSRQCDRARANPGATQPDSRRKCASNRSHAVGAMGRRGGNREDGDVFRRDRFRDRRIYKGRRRPPSSLRTIAGLTPNFLCDFNHQLELGALVGRRDAIAGRSARKSALRTYRELVELR